jgi:hypothetical protein
MANLIKEYNCLTTHVKLYENRIEIQLGSGPFSKKEMISLKNVSNVVKPAMLNCIDITTNDKKKHRIALMPKDTEELQKLLLDLL